MAELIPKHLAQIPEPEPIPWRIALQVSWSSLRRRFLRALITMVGVILAIAFLTYMLLTDRAIKALVAVDNERLNVLLQKNGVDILAIHGTDKVMMLLIGLSLLICLVGIINAMLMSVTERVKEIGTLKCLGATDGFIVRIYFIEASLQGVLGTVAGIFLGTIVAALVLLSGYGEHIVPNVPWWPWGRALIATFFIGSLISVAASIGPAYAAARKQPVEALRVEE